MPNSLYDLRQTFEENVTFGPFAPTKLPAVPSLPLKYSLLGKKLRSPFGIPACPMTVNARAVKLMSALGYDLLTYKSVRTVEWRGNPFPHWLHVDVAEPLTHPPTNPVMASFDPFTNKEITMANSFGIHSLTPEYWQADVNQAVDSLSAGQLLILSLMPTPLDGQTLVKDSSQLAKLGLETKAEVFEINLACPNTDKGKGLIHEDLVLTHKICTAVRKALGKKPLVVKVGYYQNPTMIKDFLSQNRDLIDGVATANTYPLPVQLPGGKEAFPGRPSAGVSGAGIRNLYLAQAKAFVRYKKELGLKNLALIGMGGVMKTSHIDQYLKLGVDAVQSAVGVWADPLLALKYKKKLVSTT